MIKVLTIIYFYIIIQRSSEKLHLFIFYYTYIFSLNLAKLTKVLLEGTFETIEENKDIISRKEDYNHYGIHSESKQ